MNRQDAKDAKEEKVYLDFLEIVGDSFDAVFYENVVEVDEEAECFSREFQIGH